MLNRKTTYGIHALLHLARHSEDGVVPVARISEALQVSRKFLERILADLRHEGMVESQSGRDGGYRLGTPGLDLCLADVVRVLEGPIALLPCASHRFYAPCTECQTPETCALQDALVGVRNATVHSLKQITLANLLETEGALHSGQKSLLRPTPYHEGQ